VTKVVKGYPKREWQKTRDRNEALDCRVYARAAAIAAGVDRWSDNRWEQLAGGETAGKKIEKPHPSENEVPAVRVATRAAPRSRVVRSSLM
jgi:phage terminase large subunit GpA-like protein